MLMFTTYLLNTTTGELLDQSNRNTDLAQAQAGITLIRATAQGRNTALFSMDSTSGLFLGALENTESITSSNVDPCSRLNRHRVHFYDCF